jgi:hypothetical protein
MTFLGATFSVRSCGYLGLLPCLVVWVAASAAELVPVIAEISILTAVTPPAMEGPEYNAKAGYLLKFTRYVEWPEGTFATSADPLIIGVLGTNPFGDVLEKTVQGLKSQDGRPIKVRLIATVEEAAKCQVVFIARKQERNEALWVQSLRGKPILTITESTPGLASGAVLALFLEKNLRGETKPVFSASLPAARKAGLKLSADLLQFARKVLREPVETKGEP